MNKKASASSAPPSTDPRPDPRVTAYIAKSAPFAQPILTHLRDLIHQACPGVVEDIKWSRPFFLHRDVILGNISGFKSHCSFGFWGARIGEVLRDSNLLEEGAMGSLGRIATLADLPPDTQMLALIRQAVAFIDAGQGETMIATRHRVVKAPRPAPQATPEFDAALQRAPQAAAVYARFSPSCQREYTEWIASAKRAETRDRRIEQAIVMLAEGKQRNWKYQDC